MFNLCFPVDRLSLNEVKNCPRMPGMGLYVILDNEFCLWIRTCLQFEIDMWDFKKAVNNY